MIMSFSNFSTACIQNICPKSQTNHMFISNVSIEGPVIHYLVKFHFFNFRLLFTSNLCEYKTQERLIFKNIKCNTYLQHATGIALGNKILTAGN